MRHLIILASIGLAACEQQQPSSTASDAYNDAIMNLGGDGPDENLAGDPPATTASKWTYSEEADPMTDRKTRTACVVSTNEVRLPSPYSDVRAELCLRDSPKLGRDAFVSLQGDGQILCHSYDGCRVSVRFDKGNVQTFEGTGASDYSTNIFFIPARSRLESGIKSADQTIIEVEFYQAGRQPIIFETKGFDWKKDAKGG